jgi:hypothetical protein
VPVPTVSISTYALVPAGLRGLTVTKTSTNAPQSRAQSTKGTSVLTLLEATSAAAKAGKQITHALIKTSAGVCLGTLVPIAQGM